MAEPSMRNINNWFTKKCYDFLTCNVDGPVEADQDGQLTDQFDALVGNAYFLFFI